MAWPVKSIFALISLPVFTICALTLYYYHTKDQEWKRYLKNIKKIEAEMKIPLNSVGELIGRGGENIKELQEKTQTKINLRPHKNDDEIRIIRVFGTKENVELAKKLIFEKLNPKDVEILEMWVAASACGRLIGRCGDNIQAIMNTSNAKVFVGNTKARDSKVLVRIRGKANEVLVAKKLIEEKVEEALQQRSPRTEGKVPKRNGVIRKIPEYEELIATATDSMIQVYVSSVESPFHFWLQLCSPRSVELDHLVDDMTDYYSKPENQKSHKLKEVKKGQIIASKFQHDGKWYRVEVFSVEVNESNPDESQVNVFYVDYGDLSVYRLGDLLELKPEFLHLKFQAIEVSMKGLLPKEDEWNEEATEAFSDMVHSAQWKALLVQVVCHNDMENSYRKVPIPFVRLYDPDGPQGVDIGSQLIEKGYALRDETDEAEMKNDDDDDDETEEMWTV